jgi:hypothetical protein
MTCVEELHLSLWQIAFVSLRASGKEEWIVFAPHSEQGRLKLPKVFLKLRVERHVAGIILEKIELHFVGIRTNQIKIIQRTAVRRYQAWIGDAVRVLESRRFRFQEDAEGIAIGLRGIFPIGADRVPSVA